jgi:hypothetical protein
MALFTKKFNTPSGPTSAQIKAAEAASEGAAALVGGDSNEYAGKKKSNVNDTLRRMEVNRNTKAESGNKAIADAQASSSAGKHGVTAKNKRIASAKAAQKKEMQRTEDTLEGAKFGAAVLGEDGLGRLGDDAKVQETLGRFEDISKQGLSRQEMAAERAQATRSIDSSTQTSSRALQAQLARSGVKGAVAGQQMMQQQFQGMQQKADLSQNLFLKSEQIKREGLKDFSSRLGEVKTFDLGQSAKEKDIIMQAGLGFAQMGSAKRYYNASRSRICSNGKCRKNK